MNTVVRNSIISAIMVIILCHSVFAQKVTVTKNIHYCTTQNIWEKQSQELYLDLYNPKNHADTLRPLVIALYGGGFVAGNSESEDMVAFCNRFADSGFVAASINYRLMPKMRINYANVIRAGYLATQDLSCAIRFFKVNWEKFKIDTNRIAVLGQSAGAVTILHTLFMDESQRPFETFQPDNLGPVHRIDEEYANTSPTVACAVCLWGGVMDTTIIDKDDIKTPVCLIHGAKDDIIPLNYGYSFSIKSMPYMYGSQIVSDRLKTQDIPYELHVYDNEKHAFYYDILYMYKLNSIKFDNCFNIALNFINKHFNNNR